MLTYVNFTCVNEIKGMYGRSRVNGKVEPRSTFTFTRVLSYITSIFLRAYARENYATVEIHPYWPYSRGARHETLTFPNRFYFTTKTRARNAKPFDVALNFFQHPSIQSITRFFCMVFRVVLALLTTHFSGSDHNSVCLIVTRLCK